MAASRSSTCKFFALAHEKLDNVDDILSKLEAVSHEIPSPLRHIINECKAAITSFASLPVAVLHVDRKGGILSANPKAQEWLKHICQGQFSSHTLLELLEPDSSRAFQHALEQAFNSGEMILANPLALKVEDQRGLAWQHTHLKRLPTLEDIIQIVLILSEHKQIKEQSLSTNRLPDLDSKDSFSEVTDMCHDINNNEKPEKCESLGENIFMHTTEAVLVTNIDKNIIRVNPAFERITGYSDQEVVGKNPNILSSGIHDISFYKKMWADINYTGHWTGEVTNCTADGSFYTALTTISAITDSDGCLQGYIDIQSDITILRETQAQAIKLANYDSLTGLPNRDLLNDRLEQLLRVSKRHNHGFAVMFVDLDHFKEVNDSLGHIVGDDLLVNISKQLRAMLRSGDTIARIGGDDFVVLLPETREAAALEVAEKLVIGLHKPVNLPGIPGYAPSLSVGVALFPDHAHDADTLLKFADTAVNQAKASGRNRFVLYGQTMGEQLDAKFKLRTELPLAIQRGEMLIYLQPKFDLNTRRIMGAEALIRWQHSSLSLLSPADFLPAISGTPVMEELDSWILNESIELLADWQQRGCLPTEFHIAINQTADDINTSTWADHLQALLARVDLPPARLEIELVESVLAENDSTIQNNLRQLRELGVSLAIDDFGTGYSNLAYLTRMPFTLLKIDMRFVKNMQESASDLEVVKTIITLAKALDVRTLAEGVETEEQAKLLQELGCDWAQGYLVSPPIPVEEFEKYFLG